MKLRLSTILPVGLFAVIGVVLALALNKDPRLLPSTLIGRPLPQFDLPPLTEQPGVKSAELQGGFTLINVWGSWCSTCRVEHPFLMQLAQDKRFKLVGIDWRDNDADGRQYLSTYGNPYSKLGTDQSGRTAIDLGVSGAPETFVVDPKGIVRLRIPGAIDPEIWAKQIEPLLKEAGNPS